jgi:ABC-type proline/glycine betaine transport system ATPase subunit
VTFSGFLPGPKSTTMKMVAGRRGHGPRVGHDVAKDLAAKKTAIGYLPEGAPAYPDMTPEAFLNFMRNVRGLSGRGRGAAIRDAVAKVQLEGVLRQPIETLSKGFKRRVGLAQAILHDPRAHYGRADRRPGPQPEARGPRPHQARWPETRRSSSPRTSSKRSRRVHAR